MPYIGNIVQDFSVNTAMLNTDSVTSIKIDDGTIVNADINDSAAIDVSKLSGVLPLAGGTLTGDLTLSGTAPKIVFTDTNNDPDYQFKVDSGVFTLERTAGNDQFRFNADGSFFLGGNFNTNSLISGANGLAIEGATTFNDSGADVDFRVEGDTNAHLLFVDASADKIGINESSPSHKLVVGGDIGVGFTTPNDAARQLNFNVNRGSAGASRANINWQWNSKYVAQIRGIAGADTTNKDDAHLAFFTSAANNLVERLRIDSSGRLNIGTDLSDSTMASVAGLVNIHTTNTGTHNSLTLFWDHNNLTTDIEQRIQFSLGDNASDDQYVNAGYIAIGKANTWQGNSVRSSYLSFATSNAATQAERMRIDSSGNVGIGTTSPTGKFAVSDGTTEGEINPSGGICYIGTRSNHPVTLLTNATGRMTIDTSGRLLIGTTTEGEVSADNLTIADSANCGITIRSGTSNAGAIYFSDGTSGDAEYRGLISYHQGNDYFQIFTAAAERIRIDSSGRLLIGTTTEGHAAADNLTVADTGNSGITIRSGTSNNGAVYFSDGTSGSAEYKGAIRYVHADNALSFYANGSERLVLSSGGRLELRNTSGQIRMSFENAGGLNFITSNSGEEIKVSSGNGDSNGIEFWDYTGVNKRCQIDGHGIKFNTDTSEDNALSDYEVGTFTPNNTIGMPLTNNFTAQYVKVGNLCWITMDITFDSSPADVSQCGLIQSLPFTSANITGTEQQLPMPFVSENNSANLDHDLANTVFFIEKNASSVKIYNLASNTLQTRAFLASRRMRFNFCYRTA